MLKNASIAIEEEEDGKRGESGGWKASKCEFDMLLLDTARAVFILSRCVDDSSDSEQQKRMAAQMLEVVGARVCACRAP